MRRLTWTFRGGNPKRQRKRAYQQFRFSMPSVVLLTGGADPTAQDDPQVVQMLCMNITSRATSPRMDHMDGLRNTGRPSQVVHFENPYISCRRCKPAETDQRSAVSSRAATKDRFFTGQIEYFAARETVERGRPNTDWAERYHFKNMVTWR